MNISDGIERTAARFPAKLAVVSDDGTRLTYRQLDDCANRVARHLRDGRGLQTGDRVGILAGNTIQFLTAFYGVIRAGCTAVPLNDQWSAAEFAAYAADSLPALILARPGIHGHFDIRVPVVDLDEGSGAGLFAAMSPGPLGDRPEKDDFFYIGYTSGSTGRPKGVLRCHRSWLDSYLAAAIEFGCSAEDRVLAPGALFYSLSLFAVTHALFLGSTVYITSSFDARKLLEIVERERVTTICMVPTLYEAVLKSKGASKRDLGSVRTLICAGSTWPRAKEAKKQVLELFPSAGFYDYYGAAEMSFVSVNPPEDQLKRPRSAGRPFFGVRIEIRGEDGKPLGAGQVGIIYAQSSFGFEGYHGDPERTAMVLRDGWMTVGDLGYTDEEGYLYVVGRKDNVVISGGMNVSVEEVEEVLHCHAGVALAAVFGAEDPRRGQVLVALIQKTKGTGAGLRELRAHCLARLEHHKVPRRMRFVDAIPLTASGKISRSDLPGLFSAASPVGVLPNVGPR